MKYRKKPVVIEARLYDGSNDEEIMAWAAEYGKHITSHITPTTIWLNIPTLEGDHHAKAGDFIIKGVAGEFYPCKPDIFEQTYEEVGE